MRRVSFKGVSIGAAADIALTNLLQLPLVFYVMYTLLQVGVPMDKIASSLREAMIANTLVHVVSMVFGIAASIFGGFLAAYIAGKEEILNGALSSVFCVGFGVLGVFLGSGYQSLWIQVAFLFVSPALGALGGFLRKRYVAKA